MTPSEQQRDPLEQAAAEFADRLRRGERPSLTEYSARFPDLAEEIRELFPALALMERFGSVSDRPRGFRDGPAPRVLGDYRILREIGRGGMGVVYEAEQISLGRHVALKVLPADARGPGPFRERFRREARAAARLHHTNIVPVFGVGEADGTLYYAMQFIAGQGLNVVLDDVRRLRSRPTAAPLDEATAAAGTPPEPSCPELQANRDEPAPASLVSVAVEGRYYREVARLGAQAADALHYAHGQGVLHRDIKPSNLLLDTGGTLWVADFGLAKADDSDDLTGSGDIVGTLRYMAPERFKGHADVRSDVYALGATLYEALTLRPAFDESDRLRLIDRVGRGEPARPRAVDSRVPADLETIVLKAMTPEPAGRYATAADLADDLRRFLDDRPIRARRARRQELVWRWCRRNPTTAGLVASVAALLLLIAVGASVAAVRLTAENRGRLDELFHSYVNQARSKRLSGTLGRRFDALDAIGKAAVLARELDKPQEVIRELRSEAIAALALSDLRPERTGRLPPGAGIFSANAWGRFAQDLARHVAVQNGTVIVYGADDRPSRSLNGARPATSAFVSPDGRHVVANLSGERLEVVLWDLDDLRPEPKAVLPGVFTMSSFRRDGRVFALQTEYGAVLYDVAGGPPVGHIGHVGHAASWDVDHATYWALAPDPTGRRLAAVDRSTEEAAVRVFDLATGAEEMTRPLPKRVIAEDPAWNDDGTLMAVGVGRAIHVWAFGEGPPRAVTVLERHQNASVFCRFVPGTGLLLSSAWDRMTQLWDPIGGRQLLSTTGTLAAVGADGRIAILDSAGGYAVWKLDPAAECRLLHHSRGPDPAEQNLRVLNPTFAPGGRLLATGCGDGVRVWDAATGLAAGPLLTAGHSSLLFLPGSGDLITYPATGPALRWPRTDHNGVTAFGPPRWLADGPHDAEAVPTATPDGTWLAYAADKFPQVVNTVDPTRRFVLEAHAPLRSLSLSPDGRMLATGTWKGHDLLVREVTTGRKIHTIEGNSVQGWFSPDGRRLATTDSLTFGLRDATFVPVFLREKYGGYAGAFSRDGARLAVGNGPGMVRLTDAADGRPLADLELPSPAAVMNLAFNPAGDKLAVATMDQFAAIWDLAAIRRTLGGMNLDWEDTPAPPPTSTGPPPQVEFVGTNLATDPGALRRGELDRLGLALWANPFDAAAYCERGRLLLADKQWAAAYDHFSAALALCPDRPGLRNARLAAAVRLERWADALADADALTGHWPDKTGVQSARGLALYHLGRHAEAAEEYGRLIQLFPGDPDLYVHRAECYDGLNRPADAAADRRRAEGLTRTTRSR